MEVQSLASLNGLRIRRCHELWCRSQTRPRSCIAVAVAQVGSYRSDSNSSLGTSICHRHIWKTKKTKKEKKKKKANLEVPWWYSSLRIQACHCCGLGLIPGPRTSSCCRCGQKKKKKKKKKGQKKKYLKINNLLKKTS